MIFRKLYLLALGCLLLQACNQSRTGAYHLLLQQMYAKDFPVVTARLLQEQLQQPGAPKPLLLDTRTPAEFKVSHLQDARFVDFDTFDIRQWQNMARDTPMVVYCAIGMRSQLIGQKLRKAGFTQVYNLYGGLFEWVNLGFAVYNSQGRTNQVHGYTGTWGIWLQKGEKVYD